MIKIVFNPADVQALFQVSHEEAEAFLERNEKYIHEQLVATGFEVLATFANMDGLAPVEEGKINRPKK